MFLFDDGQLGVDLVIQNTQPSVELDVVLLLFLQLGLPEVLLDLLFVGEHNEL